MILEEQGERLHEETIPIKSGGDTNGKKDEGDKDVRYKRRLV